MQSPAVMELPPPSSSSLPPPPPGAAAAPAAAEEQQQPSQQGPGADGPPACFIIMHSVSKKHNVGTIARCATAFGVREVRRRHCSPGVKAETRSQRPAENGRACHARRSAWWGPASSTRGARTALTCTCASGE